MAAALWLSAVHVALAQTAPAATVSTGTAVPAATAQAPVPAPSPTPAAAPPSLLPPWLQVHAEQRTRYETIDARYRPSEVGGDQQLGFRTRFQVGVTSARAWAFAELQDSRVELDDSASTVGTGAVAKTKVQQLHAGLAWRNVAGRGLTLQIEGGRFSRNIGSRRLISRNIYGNSTTAYDGAIASAAGKSWSAMALATRPVVYTYPGLQRDPRFNGLRLSGLYLTSTKARRANADLYALIWRDGGGTPAATRRSLNTVGGRLLGQFGHDGRADYEAELTFQGGEVGPRRQRAWMQHGQVGYHFPRAPWKPYVLAVWDYASGDADPTDDVNGGFDPLIGDRRFEFGPVGLYGLIARSNLISPGAWVIVRPVAPLETWLQVRGVWLAQARDRWRPAGLGNAAGTAGRHVGTQVEWRTRYRFTSHFDFDGGVTVLEESYFVQVLKPSPHGRSLHLYAGLDLHY